MTIGTITIAILLAISAAALLRAWRLVRTMEDTALLGSVRAGCGQSLGFVGCSVVCSGITELQQISQLLRQEYERYEVIVVIDSLQYAEALHEIISHYRMVSVNCASTLELPTTLRRLYRSRQRSYRRLIIVDVPHRSKHEDWNAGVMASSYDFILPISHGMALYDRAIENLAISLCSAEPRRVDVLHSTTSSISLLNRHTIIACGGFSQRTARQLTHAAIIRTSTPVAYRTCHSRKIFFASTAIIGLIFTLSVVSGATYDLRIAISAALTMGMLLSAARWVAISAKPGKCSIWDILYHFKKIVDIFPSRKFMV